MDRLKFLQIADFADDGAWAELAVSLPASARSALRADRISALERAADLARREDAAVVLCAGGLWDDADVLADEAGRIFEVIASLAPVPVVVAPGRLDPMHAFSYWSPRYYAARTGRKHPENLIVLGGAGPGWDRAETALLPGVEFRGRAARSDRTGNEERPDNTNSRSPAALRIGIAGVGPENSAGVADMASTLDRELADLSLDYCALGGSAHVRDDKSGEHLKAARADAGTADGARFCAFLGTVERGGVASDSVSRTVFDTRRIVRLRVPLDAAIVSAAQVLERVTRAANEAGAGPGDAVLAEIVGTADPALLADGLEICGKCDGSWLGLIADCSSLDFREAGESAAPGVSNDALRIERNFVRRIQRRESAGPAQETAVRAALRIGLAALRGGRTDISCAD